MEPLTHFLFGAALGRSGFNRKTALATLTMTLAAEAPDIDMLANLRGSVFGFAHHRGITHTFVGLPFICAAVLLLVWMIDGVQRRLRNEQKRIAKLTRLGLPTEARWGWLYLFALIAGISHILLDFTNNYGVRPLEPFSYRWYSWDIVFIYEPLLYLGLLSGLLLPALFRLVSEEIGEKRRGPRGRVGAIAALCAVVLVWSVRDYEHRRAVTAMEARIYRGADPIRVGAYPYPLNFFHWAGVAETQDFFDRVEVNSETPELDPRGNSQIRYKPEETAITDAAKKSYLGRVYLDWARFPITETEKLDRPGQGWVVRFQDLRFTYIDSDRAPLRSTVLLDPQMNVIAAWFGNRQPQATAAMR